MLIRACTLNRSNMVNHTVLKSHYSVHACVIYDGYGTKDEDIFMDMYQQVNVICMGASYEVNGHWLCAVFCMGASSKVKGHWLCAVFCMGALSEVKGHWLNAVSKLMFCDNPLASQNIKM